MPLDTRIRANAGLIRETEMRLLLTDTGLANRIPAGDGVSILCLDSEAGAIEGQPGENLPSRASGDSVACVMYTSGSTGIPKGVLVPNRGILRLVKGVDTPDRSGDVFPARVDILLRSSTVGRFAERRAMCSLLGRSHPFRSALRHRRAPVSISGHRHLSSTR